MVFITKIKIGFGNLNHILLVSFLLLFIQRTKTKRVRTTFSSKLSVLEEILINKKGFCTRVQERGVNLETARFKSLRKGQVLKSFIPIKNTNHKQMCLDCMSIKNNKSKSSFLHLKNHSKEKVFCNRELIFPLRKF